jgi:hypothetical protein
MITTGGDQGLGNNRGLVFWADGYAMNMFGADVGEEHRLLSFLLIIDNVDLGTNRMKISSENFGRHHKFEAIWVGEPKVMISIDWDKVADKVDIDGHKYERSKGTFFVILLSDRKPEIWHLMVDGRPDGNQLVETAKQQLKHVPKVVDPPTWH